MAAVTPLPPFERMSDEQRRGAACAWCGLPVWTVGAVDLGEHQDEHGVRIFPRRHDACPAPATERSA